MQSPCSSFGSVQDLRTGGCWFDPSSTKSFPRIDDSVTGLLPLSPLTIVLTMVMWKSRLKLRKNIAPSTGWKRLKDTIV